MKYTIIIIIIIISIIIAREIIRLITVVPANYAYVTEFLGKYKRTITEGVHFRVPFERITNKLSLKEKTQNISTQVFITKDNIEVETNIILFTKIKNPHKYAYVSDKPLTVAEKAAINECRILTKETSLTNILIDKGEFEKVLLQAINPTLSKWGLEASQISLLSVKVSKPYQSVLTYKEKEKIREEKEEKAQKRKEQEDEKLIDNLSYAKSLGIEKEYSYIKAAKELASGMEEASKHGATNFSVSIQGMELKKLTKRDEDTVTIVEADKTIVYLPDRGFFPNKSDIPIQEEIDETD